MPKKDKYDIRWDPVQATWRAAVVFAVLGSFCYALPHLDELLRPYLPAEDHGLWTGLLCFWIFVITGCNPFVIPIAYLICIKPDLLFIKFEEEWKNYWLVLPGFACVTYWLNGLLWLFVDQLKFPGFLQKYKIQSDKHAPDKSQSWCELVWNVLFGQVTAMGCMIAFAWFVMRGKYDVVHSFGSDDLPSHKTMFLDISKFILVDEVLFFYGHWAFHTSLLFPYHKVHHEYKAPIAIAASYSHPIENLFSNVLPFSIGPIVSGCHGYTFVVFAMLAVIGTQMHHSGYSFPWAILDHQPEFHDFHHEVFNANFGNVGLLDKWHGTDAGWAKREEFYKTSGQIVAPVRSRKVKKQVTEQKEHES